MTVASLKRLTVERFTGLSTVRDQLFPELQRLLTDLEATGYVFEVLIDGSFLTEKLDPADIDLTIIVPAFLLNLPHASVTNLLVLISDKSYSQKLDSFICLDNDANRVAYWHRQWGAGRDEKLKGYAIIRVGENDVGLRLAGISP